MAYLSIKKNPEYNYEFYDDEAIKQFILAEFGEETVNLYNRINIGAAKADFFRYAILYKKGGIYLDIDSLIKVKLDRFILPTDTAILSPEANPALYIQFALFFEAGHPFLKKTLEIVLDNLKENRYPNDVHKMTGPTAFSKAIDECLKEDSTIKYRLLGRDFDYQVKFSFRGSKTVMYGFSRKNHWRRIQRSVSILSESEK